MNYPETVIFRCVHHLLFPFDQQGKWRQFLKANIKYNVIATALLFPKVLHLGVEGRSNQRGDREMNDANRNESEIKHDRWEFGLSTLATDASVLLGEKVSFRAISNDG